MPMEKPGNDKLMPYQFPFPAEARADIVIESAIPTDERLWVPQAEKVWFRPLCLNASQGYWTNLLRVRKAGVLSRHRHPAPVHGFGETHTLYVPEDVEEMITFFTVTGVMYYVAPYGNAQGYEDVFTKIDMCKKHFEEVGLGAGYIDQFVR
ncbi:MAG TPA: 2,4'-dihydroxyacetophenone dioxygenase family protein [Noviherbaspirillum sp.]